MCPFWLFVTQKHIPIHGIPNFTTHPRWIRGMCVRVWVCKMCMQMEFIKRYAFARWCRSDYIWLGSLLLGFEFGPCMSNFASESIWMPFMPAVSPCDEIKTHKQCDTSICSCCWIMGGKSANQQDFIIKEIFPPRQMVQARIKDFLHDSKSRSEASTFPV